jgi:hypothetical protein
MAAKHGIEIVPTREKLAVNNTQYAQYIVSHALYVVTVGAVLT